MLEVVFTWSLAIGIFVVLVTTYFLYIGWIRSHYPPGPWPLPIIGNLHLMSWRPHFTLVELTKKYGPLFTIWIGKVPVIMVCKHSLYKEAMTRKGTDFDGKYFLGPFYDAVTHHHEDLVTRSYDAKVELMRKKVLECWKLGVLTKESIQSILTKEVRELIQHLSSAKGRPLDAKSIFYNFVDKSVTQVVASLDAKESKQWLKVVKAMQVGLVKSKICSLFPIFSYLLPGTTKFLDDVTLCTDTFAERCLRWHEETYREGEVRDIMDFLIKVKRQQDEASHKTPSLSRTNIGLLMVDLLLAGLDPVLSTVLWSVLLLLERPDIQKTIQMELDDLAFKKSKKSKPGTSTNEKPFLEMSDRDALPYLEAFINECMRVYPANVNSFQHQTLQNTSLGGHSIPKNTSVMFVYYAINRDTELWERASEVLPERFIDDNQNLDLAKTRNVITFGLGKRSCIGKTFAKTELTLLMSNLLLNFELSCSPAALLHSYDEGRLGLSYMPKDFEIIFTERTLNEQPVEG